MAIGKFGNKVAPAGRKPSRYAGVTAAQPRDPMPEPGRYRLRFLGAEETSNPRSGEWHRASFRVMASEGPRATAEGTDVATLFAISGKAATAGLPRVKAYIMAVAGYADEAEYDAFDSDGTFIDAIVGEQNEHAQNAAAMLGRLVDVTVTLGKPVLDREGRETGDHYREYAWEVVPDAEQEAA